jgi:hypothetical protein
MAKAYWSYIFLDAHLQKYLFIKVKYNNKVTLAFYRQSVVEVYNKTNYYLDKKNNFNSQGNERVQM